MTSLILPRRFANAKDNNTLELDGENPLIRGLAFAWTPMQGRVAVTQSGNKLCSTYAVTDSSRSGLNAAKCSTGQKNIEWASYQPIVTSDGAGTGDFTLMVCADPAAAGSGAVEHILAQKNDAASPYAQIILASHADANATYSSGSFSFFLYNGGTVQSVAVAGACSGNIHQWTGTRSNTTYTLYKDQISIGSGGISKPSILQTESRYLGLGCRGNGTTESYKDRIFYAYAWNRALTQAEISAIYRYPYSLFTKKKQRTVIYFGGAGGAQSLLPALITNSQTFYAATVTTGAVSLTPSLVTNSQTFHSATVTKGAVTLAPSLVTNGQTFHAPTVSTGSVTLEPSLVIDGQTFYAPVVANGGVTLAPSLVTNGQTFPSPTISVGAVTLTLDVVVNGQTFYAPTVAQPSGQTLEPTLVANGQVFYGPTVEGMLLTQADLDAISAAVWADPVAIAAHAKLDEIIARITC